MGNPLFDSCDYVRKKNRFINVTLSARMYMKYFTLKKSNRHEIHFWLTGEATVKMHITKKKPKNNTDMNFYCF